MQITLVSSGDTVSDAWDLIPIVNYIETAFDIEFFSFCEQHNACVKSIAQDLSNRSIHRLKEMADSLGGWFITSLLPKRNSKISLSCWISEIFLHIYTPIQVSATKDAPMIAEKAIAVADESAGKNYWCPQCEAWMDRNGFNEILHSDFQEQLCKVCGSEVCHELDRDFPVTQSVDIPSETYPTSGLIISFGKTLEYLSQKSVTRRTWRDTHAQKFINAFTQNKLVRAFDKDPRYGGKQIGWCRLSCAPYKEQLSDMPESDLLAEGGMCSTIGEFIEQYFDSNPRLEVWVVRFKFIADSVFAAEVNPVVATDQVTNSPAPEIEVLEPEEKPVYTISIVADGAFSEERVNRLPPFLINREGYLLKKSWHRSCDAGYAEITSKHLFSIAVNSGLVVRLMTENLEVSQACICCDPPPFIIDKGGVYKRDQVKRGLAVSYSQVISECLSNIVVV